MDEVQVELSGKFVIILSVRVKQEHVSFPVVGEILRQGGKIGIVHHIKAGALSCYEVVLQKAFKMSIKTFHGAHVGKLCDAGVNPEGILLAGGGSAITGARQYIDVVTGYLIVSLFGHNLTFAQKRHIFIMETASFLNSRLPVNTKTDISVLLPVSEIQVVAGSQLLDLRSVRNILVRPAVEKIIIIPAAGFQDGGGGENRNIKDSEAAAGDEYGADQKIVYRLSALKLHHAPGNDIFVWMFFPAAPAVDDSVQHDHVESHKDWRVQKIDPFRRVSGKNVHIGAGSPVADDGAGKKNDDACRAAPASKFSDRLVFMFLLHHINDVCFLQIAPCGQTGKCNDDEKEKYGYQKTPEVKVQRHFFAVHQEKPEPVPEKPDKRKSGDDSQNRGGGA